MRFMRTIRNPSSASGYNSSKYMPNKDQKSDIPSYSRNMYSELRFVFKMMKKRRFLFLSAAIALALSSSLTLAIGKALAYFLDKGMLTSGGDNPSNKPLLIFIGIAIATAVMAFVRHYFISMAGEKVAADIRKEIFSRISRFPMVFFDSRGSGDLLSCLISDIETVRSALGSSMSIAIRNFLTAVGGGAMLVITAPFLAIKVAFLIPIVAIVAILGGKKIRVMSRRTQETVASMNDCAEEVISGIEIVKIFVAEETVARNFADKVEDTVKAASIMVRTRSIVAGFIAISACFATGLVLKAGSTEILLGSITSGDLSAFMFYAVLTVSSLSSLSDISGEVSRACGAAGRIAELGEVEIERDKPNGKLIVNPSELEFRNIFFSYPFSHEKQILRDFSFKAQKGQKIAIVGSSGAGKSTFFKLLLRIYDPASGDILLNGTSFREVDCRKWRHNFGVVSQDCHVFSGSLADNVRWGDFSASDQEVTEALEKAALGDFVNELPNGIDSFIGGKGMRLSGGQKQRLAIARALIKNPSILVLDEATSSLDAISEREVNSAVSNLFKDRITLIAAHRLATIINSDTIVFIQNGTIVGKGSHDELMRTAPEYSDLVRTQFFSEDDCKG